MLPIGKTLNLLIVALSGQKLVRAKCETFRHFKNPGLSGPFLALFQPFTHGGQLAAGDGQGIRQAVQA